MPGCATHREPYLTARPLPGSSNTGVQVIGVLAPRHNMASGPAMTRESLIRTRGIELAPAVGPPATTRGAAAGAIPIQPETMEALQIPAHRISRVLARPHAASRLHAGPTTVTPGSRGASAPDWR